MKRPAAASSRIAQAAGAERMQIAELAAVNVRTARVPGCAALVDAYSILRAFQVSRSDWACKDL